MNWNLKKTITAFILLAVTATNIFWAKNQPDKFFAGYIPFSRKAVNVAGKITSFVPFSIWEIISGFLICLGIFWLVCGIRKKNLPGALSNIFLTVTALVFIFINIWGLNYFAPADPAGFGLKKEQYTPEQLQKAAEYFLTQANALALQATDSYDEERISAEKFNAAARQAKVCYEKLRQKNKNFDGKYIKPKMLTSSGYFAKEGTLGIFICVTGESCVSRYVAKLDLPYVICHETAHKKAFARENEANFRAFLACMESDEPDFLYSAYYNAFVLCFNALAKTDPEKAIALREKINNNFMEDIRTVARHYDRLENRKIVQSSGERYDAYLKSFGVQEGKQSYGMAVDLLVMWYYQCKICE